MSRTCYVRVFTVEEGTCHRHELRRHHETISQSQKHFIISSQQSQSHRHQTLAEVLFFHLPPKRRFHRARTATSAQDICPRSSCSTSTPRRAASSTLVILRAHNQANLPRCIRIGLLCYVNQVSLLKRHGAIHARRMSATRRSLTLDLLAPSRKSSKYTS